MSLFLNVTYRLRLVDLKVLERVIVLHITKAKKLQQIEALQSDRGQGIEASRQELLQLEKELARLGVRSRMSQL